jgi:hypothetical protein
MGGTYQRVARAYYSAVIPGESRTNRGCGDEEHAASSLPSNSNGNGKTATTADNINARGFTVILGLMQYKAELSDLLNMYGTDKFDSSAGLRIFGVRRLPTFTCPSILGKSTDDLVTQSDDTSSSMFFNSETLQGSSDDTGHHGSSIVHIPGFVNIEMLVLVSILGVSFGTRAIFHIVWGRE